MKKPPLDTKTGFRSQRMVKKYRLGGESIQAREQQMSGLCGSSATERTVKQCGLLDSRAVRTWWITFSLYPLPRDASWENIGLHSKVVNGTWDKDMVVFERHKMKSRMINLIKKSVRNRDCGSDQSMTVQPETHATRMGLPLTPPGAPGPRGWMAQRPRIEPNRTGVKKKMSM